MIACFLGRVPVVGLMIDCYELDSVCPKPICIVTPLSLFASCSDNLAIDKLKLPRANWPRPYNRQLKLGLG